MNGKINRANRISIALVVLTIALLLSLAVVFLFISINNHRSDKKDVLIAIAEKNKENLFEQVSSRTQLLNSHAFVIGGLENNNMELIYAHMVSMCNSTSFEKVGYGDLFGNFTFVDSAGEKYPDIDLSAAQVFNNPLQGNYYVSDYVDDDFSGHNVSYYSVPVYQNNVISGILCGINDNLLISEIFSLTLIDNLGYSFVINKDGQIVTPESKLSPKYPLLSDFKEVLAIPDADATAVMNAIQRNEKYSSETKVLGADMQIAVIPVGAYGWYYVAILNSDVLQRQFIEEIIWLGILVAVFLIAFILLVVRIVFNYRYSQKIIEEIAFFDNLTGLRNYRKFIMDANIIIKKNPKVSFAIWSLDIRKFAQINELYGRRYGNKVLTEVANALRKSQRAVIDIFCHISEDQFAGIIGYKTKDDLVEWYQSLVAAINENEAQNIEQLSLELQIGFYCLRDFNEKISVMQMVNNANLAKREFDKENVYSAFLNQKMRDDNHFRIYLENNAKNALLNEEFYFQLQPKVDIHNENEYKIASVEALCRWHNKKYGAISPGVFIPIFEDSGFIVDLDRYIFEAVCKWYQETAKWHKMNISVSVNVSRQALLREDFVDYYVGIKRKYNIKDKCLELEFTESILAQNYEAFNRVVDQLRENGFLCSIDDFGTGYSSLNLLKNINIDILKLDGLFFRETINHEKGRIIINGLLKITNYLRIKTVAEGIEDPKDVIFLIAARCNYVQGYVFSKPLDPEDFSTLYLKNSGKITYTGQK